MNSLAFNTPIADRYSEHLIKLVHHKLEIEEDLEMRAHVKLEFWTNSGTVQNPAFGEKVTSIIEANENLTPKQKANDIERFKDKRFSSTTRGSWCHPQTGQLVHPDNSGNYPEGSVTQLAFWQSLPKESFQGATLAEMVYQALLVNMQQIVDLDNI